MDFDWDLNTDAIRFAFIVIRPTTNLRWDLIRQVAHNWQGKDLTFHHSDQTTSLHQGIPASH
jgi:hypothetical protein